MPTAISFPESPVGRGTLALSSVDKEAEDKTFDYMTQAVRADARAEKAELEIVRVQAALVDAQQRQRDTAQLLERLSDANTELRAQLAQAKNTIAELESRCRDCDLNHGYLLQWKAAEKACEPKKGHKDDDNEDATPWAAAQLIVAEAEAQRQLANMEQQHVADLQRERRKHQDAVRQSQDLLQQVQQECEHWQRRCRELEHSDRHITSPVPMKRVQSAVAELDRAEFDRVRHQLREREQENDAMKRRVGQLQVELDQCKARCRVAEEDAKSSLDIVQNNKATLEKFKEEVADKERSIEQLSKDRATLEAEKKIIENDNLKNHRMAKDAICDFDRHRRQALDRSGQAEELRLQAKRMSAEAEIWRKNAREEVERKEKALSDWRDEVRKRNEIDTQMGFLDRRNNFLEHQLQNAQQRLEVTRAEKSELEHRVSNYEEASRMRMEHAATEAVATKLFHDELAHASALELRSELIERDQRVRAIAVELEDSHAEMQDILRHRQKGRDSLYDSWASLETREAQFSKVAEEEYARMQEEVENSVLELKTEKNVLEEALEERVADDEQMKHRSEQAEIDLKKAMEQLRQHRHDFVNLEGEQQVRWQEESVKLVTDLRNAERKGEKARLLYSEARDEMDTLMIWRGEADRSKHDCSLLREQISQLLEEQNSFDRRVLEWRTLCTQRERENNQIAEDLSHSRLELSAAQKHLRALREDIAYSSNETSNYPMPMADKKRLKELEAKLSASERLVKNLTSQCDELRSEKDKVQKKSPGPARTGSKGTTKPSPVPDEAAVVELKEKQHEIQELQSLLEASQRHCEKLNEKLRSQDPEAVSKEVLQARFALEDRIATLTAKLRTTENEATTFQQQLWEEQEKRAKADAQVQSLRREARRETEKLEEIHESALDRERAKEREQGQMQITELTNEKQRLEREMSQISQEVARNQARADDIIRHREREKAKSDELLRQSELTRASLEERISILEKEVGNVKHRAHEQVSILEQRLVGAENSTTVWQQRQQMLEAADLQLRQQKSELQRKESALEDLARWGEEWKTRADRHSEELCRTEADLFRAEEALASEADAGMSSSRKQDELNESARQQEFQLSEALRNVSKWQKLAQQNERSLHTFKEELEGARLKAQTVEQDRDQWLAKAEEREEVYWEAEESFGKLHLVENAARQAQADMERAKVEAVGLGSQVGQVQTQIVSLHQQNRHLKQEWETELQQCEQLREQLALAELDVEEKSMSGGDGYAAEAEVWNALKARCIELERSLAKLRGEQQEAFVEAHRVRGVLEVQQAKADTAELLAIEEEGTVRQLRAEMQENAIKLDDFMGGVREPALQPRLLPDLEEEFAQYSWPAGGASDVIVGQGDLSRALAEAHRLLGVNEPIYDSGESVSTHQMLSMSELKTKTTAALGVYRDQSSFQKQEQPVDNTFSGGEPRLRPHSSSPPAVARNSPSEQAGPVRQSAPARTSGRGRGGSPAPSGRGQSSAGPISSSGKGSSARARGGTGVTFGKAPANRGGPAGRS